MGVGARILTFSMPQNFPEQRLVFFRILLNVYSKGHNDKRVSSDPGGVWILEHKFSLSRWLSGLSKDAYLYL